MKKTFENFRFKLLAIAFLLITFSCEKENADEIITQEKFNAPSINSAKQFFNLNSQYSNTNGIQAKNSFGSLQTDWPSSKTKDYKETPEEDVDILYTPIYLDTDKDAKAFIASTEQNGTIESKLIFVLYKATNNENGLSAYVFVYNINGTLELEYNFENGQSVPFAENSSGLQSKNITDCSQLPSLTPEELLAWLAQCTIALDEVTVVGYLNETIDAGDSGGGGFDISPWVQIGGFEIPYEGGSGGSSGANPEVFISNIVSGTGFSISMALGLSLSSIQAQWLNQQTIDNQALLNAIAQFLNANKERPIDPAFNNIDPNQLPEIRDEAVEQMLGFIEILISNSNDNELGDIDINALNSLLNFNSETDWKEMLRQAIANGVTSTAEVTHQIYKKLSDIAQEHPSSISYINVMVNEFRDIAGELFDTNPQTLQWSDLFGIWLFELGDYPIINGTDTILFDGNDITTLSLQQQEGVNEARQLALDKIANNDLSNPTVSHPWTYGQGEFYDGMANGNIATSFLGSYGTNIIITQNPDGTHTLTFTVTNPSTWDSATRLRIDNDGNGTHDGIFDNTSRPNQHNPQSNPINGEINIGGNINQIWTWTEIVN